MTPPKRPAPTGPLAILVVATAVFAGRVVAQLVQAVTTVGFLPSFDAWQSGALPYPALLASQVAILAAQVVMIGRVASGRFRPSDRIRVAVGAFGIAYAAFMLLRLVAGATRYDGHWFLDAPLPSLFHIVLASFVLALVVPAPSGSPIETEGPVDGAVLLDGATYPAVLAGAVALLIGGIWLGATPPLAAYGAVGFGAVAIVALEVVRPHRRDWRPNRPTVLNDAAFLVVVQMLLPTVVSAAVVFGLARAGDDLDLTLRSAWPHHWPVVAQVVAMLLIGDVLRYWMHRALHTWQPLWAYHAVHHSPGGLYWLNVGRFHPLEKVGQLVLDSLPFVLAGVGEEVFAGYFVFYAVNGFFQHSNCRVRLGPLNWIISGPELHRWHHSRLVAESNNNYGNNLIVWDVLFGTRFLPPNREVGELGLINRSYPASFAAQMTSVFRPDLDKAAG